MLGDWAAIVLAAGRGTRMRSRLPKMLHPVAGKPMVLHVLDAVRETGIARTVAIAGFEAERVAAAVQGRAEVAVQDPPLGTGHAVLQARAALEGDARQL